MKNLKAMLIAAAVVLPFAGGAQAADIEPSIPDDVETSSALGLYLRGDIGWSFLEWDGGADDSALVGSAGVGYQFNDYFRTDITAEWSGDYEIAPGAEISTMAVMGNAYVDWANESMFTPYVGVGAGYGWVDGLAAGVDSNGFAIGASAGVAVDITNNLAIDVGYRFRDIMLDGDDTMEHQVLTGLRFSF